MRKLSFIWLLATLYASDALPREGSAQPPFRYYSTSDGLTQAAVSDLAQDRAGYLWITTQRGLNRYDGRDFRHFTIADGLPVNNLTALVTTGSSSVWVGDGEGNVSLLVGGRLLATAPPPKPGAVTDLVNHHGSVFAASAGQGLFELHRSGDLLQMKAVPGTPADIQSIESLDSILYLFAADGLYALDPHGAEPAQLLDQDISLGHADQAGRLWVVRAGHEVGHWQNGQFQALDGARLSQQIIALTSDEAGTIWVTTGSELFSFDSNASRPWLDSSRSYDGTLDVVKLFVDREQTLWLASESYLTRFLGNRFRHYRLSADTETDTVWAITQDLDGRYWFATQTRLLVRESDQSLTHIGAASGLAAGPVRGLLTDADGTIWAGVRGGGLHRVNPQSLVAEQVAGTDGLEILDLKQAPDGSIWLGTAASGLFRYDPTSQALRAFPVADHASIYTLDFGPDGSLWFGVDDIGVFRMRQPLSDAPEQTLYDHRHGLTHSMFNQIRVTGEDAAWVGTEDGGLYRLEKDRFTNLGGDTPLRDQTVYLIEPLSDGSVVVGGEQGLYQMDLASGRVVRYHPGVGFLGMETNAHATYFDRTGGLWIGTVDGATRMDTALPMATQVPLAPQLLVMETVLDRSPVQEHTGIAATDRGIHVEYAAVSLLHADQIEYSYMLEGMDEAWSAATTNRSVNYSSLKPRHYVFRVRARFAGNRWSDAVASRPFYVAAPYWQQSWFIALGVVLLISLIGGVFNYRTRVIANMNRRLREQVDERTRYIERARQNLEQSYEKLSDEIAERKKADQARAEVELRFRQAFEHAPIGMGLVDREGHMFNVNPLLKTLFWEDGSENSKRQVTDFIEAGQQTIFNALFQKLVAGDIPIFNEEIICTNAVGELRQTVICLSAVRSDDGEFLYAVLQVQDVTEARALTQQLEYQANYDELTGLLNRRSFEAQLQKAFDAGRSEEGNSSYLMFMDLDQFKIVNDTSGHVAGDQLLRAISALLQENVRSNDAVGRLGGDEFAVILWHCPAPVAERVAEAIRAAVEDFQFHWDAETFRIGVSIGAVPVNQGMGDLNELQQLADAACYAAKEAGRNRVHMACGERQDAAVEHRGEMRWVQRLRDAMDNNRFAIYGQIIRPLNPRIKEAERMEILLRMREPETRRLVPPGAFLPAAERYGLTIKMDQWVVKNLLRSLIVHEAFEAADRKYWVNLSGTSIGDRKFAEFLVDEMKRSPLPPGMINFEITETAVIRSVVEAGKLISRLRDMGCQFALDDFGSGLSSFGYLKKLPVEYLKIDGMFVRDIVHDKTDRIFVKSIIDIAHSLNIKTIAEFVEDAEILKVVGDLGADYAQGFEVHRPEMLFPQFPVLAPGSTPNVERANES